MLKKHKNKIFFTEKKHKIFVVCIIVIIIITAVFSYLNLVVNPVIIAFSQSKVQSLTQKAVSAAVYEIINKYSIYDKMITINRDANGDIDLISSNAVQINLLTREITRSAQKNLEEIGNKGVKIPIGSFSGLPIFVGRGPEINFKLVPVGSINSNFVSEFTSAGINQTNHRIYLNIISAVKILLPTANKNISTNTQMLICESIIIGKVPQTYLLSDTTDNLLDLIPD